MDENTLSDELAESTKVEPPADKSLPKELPILPLRNLVVYPQTGLPLTIGQPRSIKLIDEAVSNNRLIGLVATKNPELENPNAEDLFQIGTVGMVDRLFRAPDGTIRLIVQGIERFRIVEFTQSEPYLQAKVESYPEVIETGIEIEALARNVRDQFEHIAEMIPSIPKELVASISSIQSALQTAYTIANFQRMELKDAQEILEITS
ncbi:MAG TPA: LON peptidase substrate-binding domain-containing protein, partial [Longilinea sp.]|nr:LON peptidase substrate-binding domain-containing protein [Longilinea sp.]